jgi:flavodoxin I
MKNIAIVYYSGTGNTQMLANAIKEEILSRGARAKTISAGLFGADMLDNWDAFAFGCSANGAETLQEDTFEPMFASLLDHLDGRKLALFGSYGWGDGQWMRDWEERVRQAGGILVHESVTCLDDPDSAALEAARALGRALAN